MDFQTRLKRAMFLRGFRQADLVKATGLSDSKISCYINGRYKPNGETLSKIAAALGVTPAWLLGQDGREPLMPRPVFDEMPLYNGEPVFPGISCQEMDLVEAWRKAGEKEKQIVKLTLGMK